MTTLEYTATRTEEGRASQAAGAYEQDRQRHVQARDTLLAAEVEKMEWPLERLHALRDQRLRAMVRHAKEHSPWHARRLRHVDPERLSGDDLSMIPPMTKADLMTNWDEIVTDRRLTLDLAIRHLGRVEADGPAYLLDAYHVVASGGSTGLRGVVVWDFEGWLTAQLSTARHVVSVCKHLGLESLEPGASVGAASPIHITAAMDRTFGGPPASRNPFPVTRPLAEIVDGLNRTRPNRLFAYPTVLHGLALEARAGRLRIAPHLLICGSEPLTIEARRVIEEVFGAPLIDAYGASESWVLGVSFPGSPHLHLIEDVAVCEPVDRAGRAVPPGQTSAAMLVTNAVNRVLPLIRYELSDEVTFLAEPNPDPWAGRRIAPVAGRRDHLFAYAGGVTVHPHVFEAALTHLPDVCEYQVRQTPRGADIAVLATPGVALDGVQAGLIASLREVGLVDPHISISAVETLPRKADTGKQTRFIPLAC
jgi:phenylacetate-coenzyme A ligase PaaK-like adenylate-forming protein